MIRSTSILLLLGAVNTAMPTTSAATHSDDPPADIPAIHVRVYNYAGLPGATLRTAKDQAARIYRESGIDLLWVDCPTSADETASYPECMRLSHGPSVLQVKILDRKMTKGTQASRRECGVSMLPQDGSFAFSTSVFQPCVTSLAEKGLVSRPVALSHVIAHEIGHLLLGEGSHSGRGLMNVPWNKAQLRRAAEGRLIFTPEQASVIQAQAFKRVQPAPSP